MSNRIILGAVMLAISIAASAAKDEPTKQECPTLDHKGIEDLLRRAQITIAAVATSERSVERHYRR